MSLRIETVHDPSVVKTTEDRFVDETDGLYEGSGDDEILVLSYDEAVTIQGDLEKFARDVWTAVFGALPDIPEAAPPLDPLIPVAGEPSVTWTVNADEGLAPAEAAKRVWQQYFRRGSRQPWPDEACVFVVEAKGRSIEIDLSDDEYSHLFD